MSMHECTCVCMMHRDICIQVLIGIWVCSCTNRLYVPDSVNVLICKHVHVNYVHVHVCRHVCK